MKYLLRSVKYFLSLCVLCIALMALMLATGTSALSFDQMIWAMFHTDQYLVLYGAIVVLSAFYPLFGFKKHRLQGDITQDREQIVNAFESCGFRLHDQADGVMTFRARGILQKISLLGEDEIKVYREQGCIVVDGIRRGVAKVVYRLDSYLAMKRRNE